MGSHIFSALLYSVFLPFFFFFDFCSTTLWATPTQPAHTEIGFGWIFYCYIYSGIGMRLLLAAACRSSQRRCVYTAVRQQILNFDSKRVPKWGWTTDEEEKYKNRRRNSRIWFDILYGLLLYSGQRGMKRRMRRTKRMMIKIMVWHFAKASACVVSRDTQYNTHAHNTLLFWFVCHWTNWVRFNFHEYIALDTKCVDFWYIHCKSNNFLLWNKLFIFHWLIFIVCSVAALQKRMLFLIQWPFWDAFKDKSKRICCVIAESVGGQTITTAHVINKKKKLSNANPC